MDNYGAAARRDVQSRNLDRVLIWQKHVEAMQQLNVAREERGDASNNFTRVDLPGLHGLHDLQELIIIYLVAGLGLLALPLWRRCGRVGG